MRPTHSRACHPHAPSWRSCLSPTEKCACGRSRGPVKQVVGSRPGTGLERAAPHAASCAKQASTAAAWLAVAPLACGELRGAVRTLRHQAGVQRRGRLAGTDWRPVAPRAPQHHRLRLHSLACSPARPELDALQAYLGKSLSRGLYHAWYCRSSCMAEMLCWYAGSPHPVHLCIYPVQPRFLHPELLADTHPVYAAQSASGLHSGKYYGVSAPDEMPGDHPAVSVVKGSARGARTGGPPLAMSPLGHLSAAAPL